MLIDTHAHLWFDDFKSDLDEVLDRAKAAGVEKMIVPGTNGESSQKAIQLAKKYPGVIYPAVGIHPEDVAMAKTDEIRRLIMEHGELAVAIGEIGIDLYEEASRTTLDAQKKLFQAQCELALGFDLPVIIHTRNSFAETWEVLAELPKMPRGQFHCFSVDEVALTQVIEEGFHVSFCGNITWSKRVARLVSLVPADRLLLETDSPLMVPRDKTGSAVGGNERNEPANVRMIAELIAELRGVKMAEIEEMTTVNAKRLFKL